MFAILNTELDEEHEVGVDTGEESEQLETEEEEEKAPVVTIVDPAGNRLTIPWRFHKHQNIQKYVGFGKLYSELKYCADAVSLPQYATRSSIGTNII